MAASSSSPNSFNNSSFSSSSLFDTSNNAINTQQNAVSSSSSNNPSANSNQFPNQFPTPPTSATSSSLLSPTYSTFQQSQQSSTPSPNSIPTTSSSYSDQLLHSFQKRIQTFVYLKHSTSGNQSWFNTIRLSKRDLDLTFSSDSMKKRTLRYLLLGNSISTLFDSPTMPSSSTLDNSNHSAFDFCKSLLNIVNQLETFMETGEQPVSSSRKNHTGGASLGVGTIGKNFNFFGSVKGSKGNKRSMAMGLAATAAVAGASSQSFVGEFGGTGTGVTPEDSITSPTSLDSNLGGLGQNASQMLGGRDEAHLQIPNVPFQLDFFQTFFTLCDILSEVYHRLIFYLGSSPGLITLNQSLPSPNPQNPNPTSSGLPHNFNTQSSTLSSLMNNSNSSSSSSHQQSSSNVSTPGLFFNNNNNSSNMNTPNPNSSSSSTSNSNSYFPSPPNSIGLSSGNSISISNNGIGIGFGLDFDPSTINSNPNTNTMTSSSDRTSFDNPYNNNNLNSAQGGTIGKSGFNSGGNSGNSQAKIELMSKVDGKFKKIIAQMSKELDTLARNLIKEELNSLNPLLSELLPPLQPHPDLSSSNHSTTTTTTHSHTFSTSSSSNPTTTSQFGKASIYETSNGLPSANSISNPSASISSNSNQNLMLGLNKVHSDSSVIHAQHGNNPDHVTGRRPSIPNLNLNSALELGGGVRDRTTSNAASSFVTSSDIAVDDR